MRERDRKCVRERDRKCVCVCVCVCACRGFPVCFLLLERTPIFLHPCEPGEPTASGSCVGCLILRHQQALNGSLEPASLSTSSPPCENSFRAPMPTPPPLVQRQLPSMNTDSQPGPRVSDGRALRADSYCASPLTPPPGLGQAPRSGLVNWHRQAQH